MRDTRPAGQRSWFRRLRPGLTLLLLAAVACVPGGATMPVVTPSRTLSLDKGDGDVRATGRSVWCSRALRATPPLGPS